MKVIVLEHPMNSDWLKAKQRALVTVGLTTEKAPAEDWKIKMLKCRHSPIRKLQFAFLLSDVPYWLSTELCRHHEGIEKYVRSQRNDRTKEEIPRAKKPQGALVNMIVDINADSLMQIMNKRLCGCATKEMQELMLIIREEVIKTNPEFKQFLIPMCEYLHTCNEFNSCGKKALYFQKEKNCGNCKNYSEEYGLCCYSLGDEDYDCRLRKWVEKYEI